MPRFYIQTFGCQMNVYDSERLAQCLAEAGWLRAAEPGEADLLLANTCTVRKLAEDKAFSQIGRWVKLKKAKPDLLIGMVGCLAQHLGPTAFQRAPGIDFLAGPRSLVRVPQLAEAARLQKHVSDFADAGYGSGVPTPQPCAGGSAPVGIMEGCNQFCSYCAVPAARGRESSRPLPDILSEAAARLKAGAREIVLLGQNVNHYGRDLAGGPDFVSLLEQVSTLPGLLRLRFLTSHPADFPPHLIEAMAQLPPLCESLHLPLQSGSDAVLQAMQRGYTAKDYLSLIRSLRAAVPAMSFSTDVIVGFPGETEADFQATLDLVREVQFDFAYCFKFSLRTGTPAAGLPLQVDPEVKQERLSRLLQAIKAGTQAVYAKLVNSRERVLFEEVDNQCAGCIKGRSRTNRWIRCPGPETWLGSEKTVRILRVEDGDLVGETV